MAVTYKRRLSWAGGFTAVITAAVLSATTLPAQAAPLGQILGADAPGSVSDSYIVTLKGGTKAPSNAGKDLVETYGAKISHTYSTAINGYAVKVGEQQAKRLAADSRVASVTQDTRVSLDHQQQNGESR